MIIKNPRLHPYGVPQTWNALHSICAHTHPNIGTHTDKIRNKKFFNLEPLWTSRNLSRHLQVSVVRIHSNLHIQSLPESLPSNRS